MNLRGIFLEKNVKETIYRIVQSFFITFIFIVGYGKTDELTFSSTILATVQKFGSPDFYSMYIRGWAIYSPLFGVGAYILLYYLDNYVCLSRGLKYSTIFLALFMAFGRIISDSYYYTVSWGFLTHATRISAILFLGWFIFLWKIISALFTYFYKCQNSTVCIPALKKLENQFGTRALFLLIWVCFLISWLPRLLLKYPMYIDWDTTTILYDVIVGQKTTGYTGQMYIMKLFLKIGDWIGSDFNALFIYMTIIYFLGSLLFSFIFFYFQQRGVSRGIWYIALGITLFYPLVQDWATLISKDSNYAIAVTSFVLEVCIFLFDKSFVQKYKKLFYFFCIVSISAVLFLRMNGIFLIVPTLFSLFLLIIKQKWNIIKGHIVRFRKQIVLVFIIFTSIVVCIVTPKCIQAVYSDNDGYFGFALRYYFQGRLSHSIYEMHARKAVEIQEEGSNDIKEILGEDYERYMASQYGYGIDWTQPCYLDIEKRNRLTEYLIKNDLPLCIEAMIAILYGHFDFLKGDFYFYGKNNAFFYYEMDDWYEQVVATHENCYNFLKDADENVRAIPFLHILDNVGTYIWLLISASVFLSITTGRKTLIVCLPLFITLVGSCLSSYNAYIRMCAPIVLGVPILLLMCPLKDT